MLLIDAFVELPRQADRFGFPHCVAKLLEFGWRQVSLALAVGIELDACAGAGVDVAVFHGIGEDSAEKPDGSRRGALAARNRDAIALLVGQDLRCLPGGDGPHKALDVAARYVADLLRSQKGLDVARDPALVGRDGGGLLLVAALGQIFVAQFGNGHFGPAPGLGFSFVDTELRVRQDGAGLVSRLVDRHRTMCADGHLPGPSVEIVLRDVGFASGGARSDAEAGKLPAPRHIVAVARLQGIDNRFRQRGLGHWSTSWVGHGQVTAGKFMPSWVR